MNDKHSFSRRVPEGKRTATDFSESKQLFIHKNSSSTSFVTDTFGEKYEVLYSMYFKQVCVKLTVMLESNGQEREKGSSSSRAFSWETSSHQTIPVLDWWSKHCFESRAKHQNMDTLQAQWPVLRLNNNSIDPVVTRETLHGPRKFLSYWTIDDGDGGTSSETEETLGTDKIRGDVFEMGRSCPLDNKNNWVVVGGGGGWVNWSARMTTICVAFDELDVGATTAGTTDDVAADDDAKAIKSLVLLITGDIFGTVLLLTEREACLEDDVSLTSRMRASPEEESCTCLSVLMSLESSTNFLPDVFHSLMTVSIPSRQGFGIETPVICRRESYLSTNFFRVDTSCLKDSNSFLCSSSKDFLSRFSFVFFREEM